MLTCALRADVKEPTKNNFALENIIVQLFKSWMHDFWYVYFYNFFFNICTWGHKL